MRSSAKESGAFLQALFELAPVGLRIPSVDVPLGVIGVFSKRIFFAHLCSFEIEVAVSENGPYIFSSIWLYLRIFGYHINHGISLAIPVPNALFLCDVLDAGRLASGEIKVFLEGNFDLCCYIVEREHLSILLTIRANCTFPLVLDFGREELVTHT